MLDAAAVAVSQPIEHLAGPPQRLFDRGFTKGLAAEVKSIELAQPWKSVNPPSARGIGRQGNRRRISAEGAVVAVLDHDEDKCAAPPRRGAAALRHYVDRLGPVRLMDDAIPMRGGSCPLTGR